MPPNTSRRFSFSSIKFVRQLRYGQVLYKPLFTNQSFNNIWVPYNNHSIIENWVSNKNSDSIIINHDDLYYELKVLNGFTFYDELFSKIYISNNGYLSFSPDFTYLVNINNHLSNKRISALFSDMYLDNNSEVRYYLNEAVLVITYINVKNFYNNVKNTFQIKLWLNTTPEAGSIQIIWNNVSTKYPNGCLIGLSSGKLTDKNLINYFSMDEIKTLNNKKIINDNSVLGVDNKVLHLYNKFKHPWNNTDDIIINKININDKTKDNKNLYFSNYLQVNGGYLKLKKEHIPFSQIGVLEEGHDIGSFSMSFWISADKNTNEDTVEILKMTNNENTIFSINFSSMINSDSEYSYNRYYKMFI